MIFIEDQSVRLCETRCQRLSLPYTGDNIEFYGTEKTAGWVAEDAKRL